MKKLITILFSFIILTSNARANGPAVFQMPTGLTAQDYFAKTIIIKVKDEHRSACSVNDIELFALNKVLNAVGVFRVKKMFPNHQPPATRFNQYGFKYADLSLIYIVEYTLDAELAKVINNLNQTGLLEYAEPKYIPHVCYNPNDPQAGTQSFLTRINAYGGWDISKGDTNVVIGIVDTGSDLDHPDLAANLQHNDNDPINNIDDDGDGYVDNNNGWDLAENDNNPTVGTCGTCLHGSHVSGCADAVTDNNTGVASPGFKCRFLPVKIANASGTLTVPYEGIVYAADHGCQIINCSWGGGGGGTFGQDIFDYATINKDALVVVAAGNSNTSELFYPAAYNYAFCVAATNSSNDIKASFSNYGTYIDVAAPGNGIYSTVYNNSYTSMSGTSMASPITAGVAAVVKSFFPNYNALQVGEQVRITTDYIYNVSGNGVYLDKLGSGRINMLNALTLSGPSVRMNPINFTDHNDNIFLPGDTLFITGNITDFLDPTSNLIVTLTSTSPNVTIIDGTTLVGALGTMATTNNNADPFIVLIKPNTPLNAVLTFKLLYQDGSYNDFQLFDKTVNVDYIDIAMNDVWTSNTSKGRLCYNGTNQANGLGFDFLNQGTLTYETGFMAGTTSTVSDNMRAATNAFDNDFLSLLKIQKNDPGIVSDFDTYGRFSDASNPSPLGIMVNHRSLSWSASPNARYHIFEYTMINNGISALNNLFAGVFSDWDVQNANNNKAAVDIVNRMGYIWCTDANGLYVGTKLLTATPFVHYALDNVAGGGGGVDPSNGFTNTEKYTTLSTNRAVAGGTGTGNDVMNTISSGPFSINPGDSVTVAFALIAGESLIDITNSAIQAQIQYNLVTEIHELKSETDNLMIYPNPASSELNIYYTVKERTMVNVQIYDLSGRVVSEINNSIQNAGIQMLRFNASSLNEGFYLLEISTPNGKNVQKLTIAR